PKVALDESTDYLASLTQRKAELEELFVKFRLIEAGMAENDARLAELTRLEEYAIRIDDHLTDFIRQEEYVEALLGHLAAEAAGLNVQTEVVKGEVDMLLLEVGGLDAILLRAELTRAEIAAAEVEIAAAEAEALTLKGIVEDINLPTVSRASRMILLRIPGLREVLRLMYQIKMMQTSLLAGPLGVTVAMIVALMYIMQAMDTRQKNLEARMAKLEADTDLRTISLEEAVRGYGELPQRYRSGVPPS
ncbi:unnamed protein product, partial [marine sediment metagenome]